MPPVGPIEQLSPWVTIVEQWHAGVQMQARRVFETSSFNPFSHFASGVQDRPDDLLRHGHEQTVDLHLFAVTLLNLVRAAEMAREEADYPGSWANVDEISDAIAEFEEQTRGLRSLRNVLEHFDEYLLGRGRLQRSGKFGRPSQLISSGSTADGAPAVEYRVGNLELDVASALQAADRLGGRVVTALCHTPILLSEFWAGDDASTTSESGDATS
jgi:hypothetical protein